MSMGPAGLKAGPPKGTGTKARRGSGSRLSGTPATAVAGISPSGTKGRLPKTRSGRKLGRRRGSSTATPVRAVAALELPDDEEKQKEVVVERLAEAQLQLPTRSESPNSARRRLVRPVLSPDGMPDRDFLKSRHQYFRDAHAIREAIAKRLVLKRKESIHFQQRKRMAELSGRSTSHM